MIKKSRQVVIQPDFDSRQRMKRKEEKMRGERERGIWFQSPLGFETLSAETMNKGSGDARASGRKGELF